MKTVEPVDHSSAFLFALNSDLEEDKIVERIAPPIIGNLIVRHARPVHRNEPIIHPEHHRKEGSTIMSLEFTEANFEAEVLNSDQPVLIDFWALWCPSCLALGPMIDELANDMEGKAKVGKMNVDENQDLAAKLGIRGIPAMLIFKDGEIADRLIGGGLKKGQLADRLSELANVTA